MCVWLFISRSLEVVVDTRFALRVRRASASKACHHTSKDQIELIYTSQRRGDKGQGWDLVTTVASYSTYYYILLLYYYNLYITSYLHIGVLFPNRSWSWAVLCIIRINIILNINTYYVLLIPASFGVRTDGYSVARPQRIWKYNIIYGRGRDRSGTQKAKLHVNTWWNDKLMTLTHSLHLGLGGSRPLGTCVEWSHYRILAWCTYRIDRVSCQSIWSEMHLPDLPVPASRSGEWCNGVTKRCVQWCNSCRLHSSPPPVRWPSPPYVAIRQPCTEVWKRTFAEDNGELGWLPLARGMFLHLHYLAPALSGDSRGGHESLHTPYWFSIQHMRFPYAGE